MHREVVKLEYRVSELEQQRAELLEALKALEMVASLTAVEDKFERGLLGIALSNARHTITKAEAAE